MTYLDSSSAISLLLDEVSGMVVKRAIDGRSLTSGRLLEAEALSVLKREEMPPGKFDELSNSIVWTEPTRSLRVEIDRILNSSYLRGTDLQHLATALYIFEIPSSAFFCSLDKNQRRAAEKCGFKLLPAEL